MKLREVEESLLFLTTSFQEKERKSVRVPHLDHATLKPSVKYVTYLINSVVSKLFSQVTASIFN